MVNSLRWTCWKWSTTEWTSLNKHLSSGHDDPLWAHFQDLLGSLSFVGPKNDRFCVGRMDSGHEQTKHLFWKASVIQLAFLGTFSFREPACDGSSEPSVFRLKNARKRARSAQGMPRNTIYGDQRLYISPSWGSQKDQRSRTPWEVILVCFCNIHSQNAWGSYCANQGAGSSVWQVPLRSNPLR